MKQEFLKTEKEIIAWLEKYKIKNYTIIPDKKYRFTVNVNGETDLYDNNLTIIPIKFNIINGSLYCENNNLTSLEFCPHTINGTFDCSNNQLTSLEFCPEKVLYYFNCSQNFIKNYIYFPKNIGYEVWLNDDKEYAFEEAYKIHLKDKAEYEKKLLNEIIIKKNVKKIDKKFKI